MRRQIIVALMTAALLASTTPTLASHPGEGPSPGVTPPTQPSRPSEPAKLLVVTGILEFDTLAGLPHYTVAGYVLLGPEAGSLERLVGTTVTVTGTLAALPSILMRNMLEVHDLKPHDHVGIPADPPTRLLFGRITPVCDLLFLEQPGGKLLPLTGTRLVAPLAGQQVAIEATPGLVGPHGTAYLVQRAMVLSGDIGPLLTATSLYHLPARPIQVLVAGQPLPMDQAPIMAGGRTLVAIRAVAEAMGAQVDWHPAAQQVTVRRGDRQVLLTVGSPLITQMHQGHTESFLADIAPVIAGGRTMVPVRVLAEGLGLTVTWDGRNWAVTVQ